MKCWLKKKSFSKVVFEDELVEKFITKLLNMITVAVETRLGLVVVGGWGLMGMMAGGRKGDLWSWIGLTTSPRHS